jgi:uncharacterized protein with GYD domain
MPRFLLIADYTAQGAQGLMTAGGSARKTAVEKTVSSLGGRLETFDFAFGGDDLYTVLDMPDTESMAALALTVRGTGAVDVRTIVLLSPEQLDRASQLRPDYTPPGQTG